MKSTMDDMALPNVNAEATSAGASGDVEGIFDDEPMCIWMDTPCSAHAAKNGSQYSVWIDGRPR